PIVELDRLGAFSRAMAEDGLPEGCDGTRVVGRQREGKGPAPGRLRRDVHVAGKFRDPFCESDVALGEPAGAVRHEGEMHPGEAEVEIRGGIQGFRDIDRARDELGSADHGSAPEAGRQAPVQHPPVRERRTGLDLAGREHRCHTGMLARPPGAVEGTRAAGLHYSRMAPRDADLTSLAYLPSTPLVNDGGRGRQPCRRRSSSAGSTSRSSVPEATSRRMRSPFCTNAIGPPSTASGAMWPTQSPVVPPEKRPSVMS